MHDPEHNTINLNLAYYERIMSDLRGVKDKVETLEQENAELRKLIELFVKAIKNCGSICKHTLGVQKALETWQKGKDGK